MSKQKVFLPFFILVFFLVGASASQDTFQVEVQFDEPLGKKEIFLAWLEHKDGRQISPTDTVPYPVHQNRSILTFPTQSEPSNLIVITVKESWPRLYQTTPVQAEETRLIRIILDKDASSVSR